MSKSKVLFISTLILLFTLPLFAQSVDTVWVRSYIGPGTYDALWGIGVDAFGNVYVTGASDNADPAIGTDYATLKYYPNGDTAWLRRYKNEPIVAGDEPYALAVDSSGNAYVTGYSYGYSLLTYEDYTTVKYYPNGDTAWLRKHTDPGGHFSFDIARAIAVDHAGNVYVTGESKLDFVTIKYYPNGDTAWLRAYNGPENDYDNPEDIAVDDSGNVYVTGESWGNTTGYDYATLKYYPNGELAWVKRYNGSGPHLFDVPSAIAIDVLGNVYVTGTSDAYLNGEDYLTIKYYPNGDTAWTRRYNRGELIDEYAWNIAVDESGNAYVVGEGGTIKYDSQGNLLWVDPTSASAITLDDSNYAYTNGGGGTIKYHPSGKKLWIGSWGGRFITVDDSYNVYVAGTSGGHYRTVKYKQIYFLRGDANSDGKVTISDAVHTINYLFKGGPPPSPLLSADCDCDGKVTISDVVFLINYLFKGGPPPDCSVSGRLTGYTGCKSVQKGAVTDSIPNDQDCISYQYDGEGVLKLKHINAGFNCCPDSLLAKITMEDNFISIEESESLTHPCHCNCLFDLEFEIINLEPGEYLVKVIEPYVLPGDELLEFSVSLPPSPVSGIYCVKRTHYPWGL